MFELFSGEVLWHASPVEFTGNLCSHNCQYCFANILTTSRKSELKSSIKFAREFRKRKTLMASYVKLGYPICISNKTDPFSKNNYKETLAILPYLAQLPNGLYFQTKGGYGIDDAIEILERAGKKNVEWYVTVTTLDSEIAKRVELGAPPPAERLKMLRKLNEKGFLTLVGVNPFSHEWIPENKTQEFIDALYDNGVRDILVQPLHFKARQAKNFSQKRISALGQSVVDVACKGVAGDEDLAIDLLLLASDKMNVNYHWYPFFNNTTEKEIMHLGKVFPTNYEFYNYLYKTKEKGDIVTKQDYIDFFKMNNPDLFKLRHKGFSGYIYMNNRKRWIHGATAKYVNSFEGFLKEVWDDSEFDTSPQNIKIFSVLEKEDSEKSSDIELVFEKPDING